MLRPMQARFQLAATLANLLQGYAAMGMLVALAFIVLLPRLEPTARGASLGARIAIIPGAVLLWPYVLLTSLRRLRNERQAARESART